MSDDKAIIPQRVTDDERPVRALVPAAHTEPGELSVGDLVAQVRKVQEVMDAVMKRDFHYGVIPGCGDKPTLFKPGAEKLALVFRLCPSFDVTETDLGNGHRHFRVTCVLTHITTGAKIAEGVGYGSTMESKYRWRQGQRKCPKCGKPAIIKGKAEYGGGWLCWPKKDGCNSKWPDGAKEIEGQSVDRVENPDIADAYNTVLKMAKKRAQIDATLTATGASDIFAQDLEDLAEAAANIKPTPAPAKQSPEEGAAEMGDAFDEADARSFIERIKSAATVEAVAAIEAEAARLESAEARQKIHKAAGAARSAFKRAEAKPEAKAAKPAGTPKMLDALLLSLDKAQCLADVKAVYEESRKWAWSSEDRDRLMDRVSMRKADFENAA